MVIFEKSLFIFLFFLKARASDHKPGNDGHARQRTCLDAADDNTAFCKHKQNTKSGKLRKSREHGTDSLALVLNEAAVKFMGLANPIDEEISWQAVALFF